MLIHRLLAALTLLAPFAAQAEFNCQTPHAEYSALEEICPFSEGLAAIRINDAWGYVDRQGKLVIPPGFDDAKAFSGDFAAVARDEKWGYIDRSGKLVVPLQYSHANDFHEGLAAVEKDGKEGYIDSQNRFVVAPEFALASDFVDGIAVVETTPSHYALIDKRGEIVHRFADDITIDYWKRPGGRLLATRKFAPELRSLDGRRKTVPAAAGDFPVVADDVYFVAEYREQKNLYGIMDQQGNWLVEPKFDSVESFHDGLVIAGLDEQLGAVDKAGKWVIPAAHKMLRRNENGQYLGIGLGENPLTYLYDRHGKVLLSLTCPEASDQVAGEWTLLMHCGDTTWAIHRDGARHQLAIRNADGIGHHGNRLLLTARKEGDSEALDFYLLVPDRIILSSSQPGLETTYDQVSLLAASGDASGLPLAVLSKGYRELAILTTAGKLLSQPEWMYDSDLLAYFYDNGDRLSEGPMIVRTERAWGAIDGEGKWVVQPVYDDISFFRQGSALAKKGDAEYLIDRQGRALELPAGDRHALLDAGIISLRSEDRQLSIYRLRDGVFEPLSLAGDIEIGKRFIGGLLPARQGELWGMLDRDLKWAVAPSSVSQPEPLFVGKELLGWKVSRYTRDGSSLSSLYGMIDGQGKLSIPVRYDELSVEEKLGLLSVTYAGIHHGLLRPDGSVVVAPEFESVNTDLDNWLMLRRHEHRGLMDTAGRWVVGPDHYYFESLDRGPYAHEKVFEEERLVLPDGRVSTRRNPLVWAEETSASWWPKVVDEYGDNEHTVYYGFDWQERVRLPGAGKEGFSEGWTVFARHNDKAGLWLGNTAGQQIGPLPYEKIEPFSGGLASVIKQVESKPSKKGGETSRQLQGFIDTRGRLAIPARFEAATDFAEGRSIVILKGNLGIIDEQGKLVLHSAWRCGKEAVLLNGRGTVVWPAGKSGC